MWCVDKIRGEVEFADVDTDELWRDETRVAGVYAWLASVDPLVASIHRQSIVGWTPLCPHEDSVGVRLAARNNADEFQGSDPRTIIERVLGFEPKTPLHPALIEWVESTRLMTSTWRGQHKTRDNAPLPWLEPPLPGRLSIAINHHYFNAYGSTPVIGSSSGQECLRAEHMPIDLFVLHPAGSIWSDVESVDTRDTPGFLTTEDTHGKATKYLLVSAVVQGNLVEALRDGYFVIHSRANKRVVCAQMSPETRSRPILVSRWRAVE